MTKPRHMDTDLGWIKRELASIKRQILESNAAKRLQAATIGAGGLSIKDSGRLRVFFSDDRPAFEFSPFFVDGETVGARLLMYREDSQPGDERVVFAVQRWQVGHPTYPAGFSSMQFGGDQAYIIATGDTLIGGGNGGIIYLSETSGLLLSHPTLGVRIAHETTANAANCYIDPVDARVYRVSSSRRYKQDIADADIDVTQVLKLTPRAFRRKDEVAEHGDDAPAYVGFVAEEAADLGLDHWVTSDDHGPESFSYSSWGVAQQAVIRAQQRQIDDLTARIEQLEANR